MNLQDILKRLQLQRQNPNGVGQNTGPFYTEPGLASVGGSVQLPFGLPQVGGVVGMDDGTPYGGININHNPVASFGPTDGQVMPQNQGVARPAMPMMQSQQPMMANPQNISNMNSPVANSSAVMTLMNLLKQRGL